MAKRSKHTRPAGFTAERAKFWCVSLRVMQLWLASDVPVESTPKMIAWYSRLPAVKQNKLTPAFRARITQLRTGTGLSQDPDVVEFEKNYKPDADNDQAALESLKKQRDFFLFKQVKCTAAKDEAGAAFALRQIDGLSGIIHDMELRAQKLGRDLGDLVPRSSLEGPARLLGYHLLRCADAAREEMVATLTVRDPAGAPLLPEEIRNRLDPILLNAFVLQPIRRAAAGNNSAAPPDWLVAALDAGLADILEETKLNRTTAPAVPGA